MVLKAQSPLVVLNNPWFADVFGRSLNFGVVVNQYAIVDYSDVAGCF